MLFVTSDTHFFDQHMLGMTAFSQRPFFDIRTMNETIIQNWNAVVTPGDTVYHLGDIAVHFIRHESQSHADVLTILSRLNGNLILIKGNHDNRSLNIWINIIIVLIINLNFHFMMLVHSLNITLANTI